MRYDLPSEMIRSIRTEDFKKYLSHNLIKHSLIITTIVAIFVAGYFIGSTRSTGLARENGLADGAAVGFIKGYDLAIESMPKLTLREHMKFWFGENPKQVGEAFQQQKKPK